MAIEPICNNCRLFDPHKGECKVSILHEGKSVHLPVSPEDKCFFETEFTAKQPRFNDDGRYIGNKQVKFKTEVKQVRWWVEDPDTGEPTKGDGVVKIEYPEGYFGDETNKPIGE